MTPDFTIRPITDYGEMKRAVEFQKLIWGVGFGELVPAAVFWFTSRIGAILAAAYDPGGQMIGLLFGVTGWSASGPIHWSDMLGVHPAARGRGVGIALKHYQRERLLNAGVPAAEWTFDPLESRNAWINFARLGVTSREYVRDCYGASASPLHRGIGTDRLIAHWELAAARVRERMEGAGGESTARQAGAEDAPLVNPAGEALRLDLAERRVRIRIPSDIQRVKERDEVTARRWRDQTRAAFEAYFGRGYTAMDLVRLDGAFSAYVLEGAD